MSVYFRGDGSILSSAALPGSPAPMGFKDTIPDDFYTDEQNVRSREGDGGYDFIYTRGKPKAVIPLRWAMLPYAPSVGGGYINLEKLWAYIGRTGWVWLQTVDLDDTIGKAERTNVNVQSANFIRDAAYTPANERRPCFKWIVWTSGSNVGKMARIIEHFSDATLGLDRNFTTANGDKFYVGYPVRIVNDIKPARVGQMITHVNVELICKVVLF